MLEVASISYATYYYNMRESIGKNLSNVTCDLCTDRFSLFCYKEKITTRVGVMRSGKVVPGRTTATESLLNELEKEHIFSHEWQVMIKWWWFPPTHKYVPLLLSTFYFSAVWLALTAASAAARNRPLLSAARLSLFHSAAARWPHSTHPQVWRRAVSKGAISSSARLIWWRLSLTLRQQISMRGGRYWW